MRTMVMRWLCWALSVLVCACLYPPQSHAGEPSAPLVRTLALGDSFSAGVGAGEYLPGPCLRSRFAWAARWVAIANARVSTSRVQIIWLAAVRP